MNLFIKLSHLKIEIYESELLRWGAALELGDKAKAHIKTNPLSYYLNELFQIRKNTLLQLKLKSDDWLYEEHKWGNGVPYNNYYLWFHVMEDEINHWVDKND